MAKNKLKMNKFLTGAVTATMVATAVVPMASANVAAAKEFSDVPATDAHYQNIMQAVERGLFNGYADGTFKPYRDLSRGNVAKVLANYVVSQDGSADYAAYIEKHDLATNVKAFSDVSSTHSDKELFNASLIVKEAGIFDGSNNNLMPTKTISRQQMAKVLVNGFGLKDLPGDLSKVTDNSKAFAEFVPYINILSENGVTTETSFKPASKVKRAQMASFLNRAYDVADKAMGAGVVSVSAINNTTVEVTFKEAIEDVKALNFKIEGLTVENAVVKQTGGDKVVVLTTSAQEADKAYTVNLDGKKVGTFKGVSAVIPTGIDVVTKSQQGIIGEEVTVSAKVKVAEGQSVSSIPVTFNINNTDAGKNTKVEVEAITNADGVATYSYTRYYAGQDDVVAYATKKSSVYSSAKVYWANAAQLTIKDVTGVNTLANNDSKVYEINSAKNAGKYVFVTFKENLDQTADKLVRTVGAKGSSTFLLNSNNTVSAVSSAYPYEIKTGAKAVIAVKLDPNGKANLVLAGSNATVTPIVYEGVAGVDGTDAGNVVGDDVSEFTNASFNEQALQAAAPALTFDAKHLLGLKIEAKGVANAATYKSATETGGRDYTITYVDKDGKPAKAGTPVQIAIPVQQASDNVFLVNANGSIDSGTRLGDYRVFSKTVTGLEGKVDFTVGSSQITQYAEPIAYIDNGTGIGAKLGLDLTDLQAKGEATHFTDAVTYSTALKLVDAAGKEIKSVFANGEHAYFEYATVDQNGKKRAYRTPSTDVYAATTVTYTVQAGTSPVTVVGHANPVISAGGNGTYEVVIPAGASSGRLQVSATVATTATVSATATVAGLVLGTTNAVTATFTDTSVVNVNGTVTDVNKTTNVVKIGNVPYSLAGATYLNQGTVVPTLAAFYDHLTVGKAVSVTKDADGKLVFNVTGIATVGTGKLVSAVVSDETADAAGLVDTITFTFDKDVVASTVAAGDFTAMGYTLAGTPVVAGKTVKFSITPAAAAAGTTVTTVADTIGFTDGLGNAVDTTFAVAIGSKVSKLFTTANRIGVTQVDSKGELTLATTTNTIKLVVANTELNQADYNGLSVKFVRGASLAGNPTATYNSGTRQIEIALSFNDGNNTKVNIDAAIASLVAHSTVDFTKVTLDAASYLPKDADVVSPLTVALTGGVTAVAAQVGQYNFATYPTLVVGSTVTLNNITYTKVISGLAVAANKTFNTDAELLAAIKLDPRFDASSSETGGVFTLVDAVTNGSAAPTLSAN